MGCGCNKNRPLPMNHKRPTRNLVQSEGVLRAVATNHGSTTPPTKEQTAQVEEKRKIDRLRRDAILRALGRP